ncbi:hypothetical protein [Tahibacter harae]|uniref:Uncharacterized protein n=1 Tax=Tahibacter harae TaxID=2963937 RepID=A0ABT1QUT3_9GAMM|nr:hypothetical protein [Tahibacter harae]MCQ4166047.1 hypothetical protein [Tahibacter harae]
MPHDQIAKPAAGRYFPFSAGELARQAAGFSTHAYSPAPPRIDLQLKNCTVECRHGHQLCTFLRRSYLAAFSLPETVPAGLARQAVEAALQHFATIDSGPYPALRQQQRVAYRAFLGPVGKLCVTEHRFNAQDIPWLSTDRVVMLSARQRECRDQRVLLQLQLC